GGAHESGGLHTFGIEEDQHGVGVFCLASSQPFFHGPRGVAGVADGGAEFAQNGAVNRTVLDELFDTLELLDGLANLVGDIGGIRTRRSWRCRNRSSSGVIATLGGVVIVGLGLGKLQAPDILIEFEQLDADLVLGGTAALAHPSHTEMGLLHASGNADPFARADYSGEAADA